MRSRYLRGLTQAWAARAAGGDLLGSSSTPKLESASDRLMGKRNRYPPRSLFDRKNQHAKIMIGEGTIAIIYIRL